VPADSDDLYDVLTRFVTRLINVAESDGMDAMIDLDLSFSQVRMVFLLAKTAEPMSIHAIAAGIGLSDAAAGRNVEQLSKIGVVERQESPDDRRVKLVTLAPTGQHLAATHMDAKRDTIKAFAAALPTDQRDHLHRALSDILAGNTFGPRTNQEICP
jgi:DNA-binding MarR family transcriptional regulator